MKTINYRVRSGDVLSSIARRHKITEEVLSQVNNISELNPIRPDQVLRIPQEGQYTTRALAQSQSAQARAAGTLAKIVQQNKIMGEVRRHTPPPTEKAGDPLVDYPIKVPRGVKTEEELDQYAEVLIFGRVLNIPWQKKGWQVSQFAQHGKTVIYRYHLSELRRHGGREASKVVRPAARNPAYDRFHGITRHALSSEIDRRYWTGTKILQGQRINKGEQSKEDMWNFYRDELMDEHQRLKDLPLQFKSLMRDESVFKIEDYARLLRIAEKLKQFTPQDIEMFKLVAVRTSHDLDLFESSVDRFLGRKEELRQAFEELQRRSKDTTPSTMEAAIEGAWVGVDLSKVGQMSLSDQSALAQRQTAEVTRAQFLYMASHPGEVAVDFVKTATLMNTGETFAAIGKDLSDASTGDVSAWARWAAGLGAGAKLSGWLLAAGGVLYALSWLTGAGELATIAAVMGRLLLTTMALSFLESKLRVEAASRAKTPEEFKQQVNKAAASRLNWQIMLAMLGLALALRFVAKTFFPQTVKNIQTSLSRLRERVRIFGKLADKKTEIVSEMKGNRGRLEQEGRAAKDANSAQAEALELMTLDEFIAKMDSGELLPEAKLQTGQEISWKQLAETPEGLESVGACRYRFVSELRSEALNEIDALVKEQTDAIDATLDKVNKATLPEELSKALDEHERFLGEEEVAARAKVREQRILQRVVEAELGFKDPTPPELRTLAETLRRPLTQTGTATLQAKRFEVISEVRNVHGAERPPQYDGHIFDRILVENQAALARSRAALHSMKPDVIVGMERGGSFLTEALTQEDPVLAAKVRKMQVHKAPEGQSANVGKYDGPKMEAEFQKLIDGGAKRIVVYDAYMGGRTARSLINQVFKPLLAKHPEVNFHLYWLRETFGLRGKDVVGIKNMSPGIQTTVEEVTLVLGDDMDVVMSPDGQAPIRIFNSEGQVTREVFAQPGESTRQVMIKLLNSSSSPTSPPGTGGLPVMPAPPSSRPKNNRGDR